MVVDNPCEACAILSDEFTISVQIKPDECVLFVDISNSTQLYERLGDKQARKITQQCLQRLIMQVVNHNGRVIKTIGDEVMCQFGSLADATLASVTMLESLKQEGTTDDHALTVKIGLHCGPVIEEAGDLFGDTVNTAARIIAQARPGQILTSGCCREKLQELLPAQRTRWFKSAWLKGKAGTTELFEVVWENESDRTISLTDTAALRLTSATITRQQQKLELRFGRQTAIVDSSNTSITIGRSHSNDFVVSSSTASREHARIEFRPPSHFMVVDQSTNGTLVVLGKREYRLLHDEMMLLQDGWLKIGLQEGDCDVINFKLFNMDTKGHV